MTTTSRTSGTTGNRNNQIIKPPSENFDVHSGYVGRGLAPAANRKRIPSTLMVGGIEFSNQFCNQSMSAIDVLNAASSQKQIHQTMLSSCALYYQNYQDKYIPHGIASILLSLDIIIQEMTSRCLFSDISHRLSSELFQYICTHLSFVN